MAVDFTTHPEAPYYDHYDNLKKFSQVLVGAGRPAQGREINEVQSMLRDFLSRIGDVLFKQAAIISGSSLEIVDIGGQLTARISAGSVYLRGIVQNTDAIDIPITGVGDEVIGVKENVTIVTKNEDPSLNDPAQGFPAFGQQGADRQKTDVVWANADGDPDVVAVFFLKDGEQKVAVNTPEISGIIDILAKRDYEKSGNYILEGFSCVVEDADPVSDDKKILRVKSGKARRRGYDVGILIDTQLDLPVSRETDTQIDEPFVFNAGTDTYLLGERPVASVEIVTATVRTVQTPSLSNAMVKGILGSSDELAADWADLSTPSVLSIVAVNFGGTWDGPGTTTFTGGTNYTENVKWQKDGNNINWSLNGNATPADEPPPGASYSVIYDHRYELKQELKEATEVLAETLVKNTDDTLNNVDILDSGLVTLIVGDTSGQSDYNEGTDFTLNRTTGVITWIGTEPGVGNTYFVTYTYWNIVGDGDFLARDSYFKTFVAEGDPANVPYRYGIPDPHSISFLAQGATVSVFDEIVDTGLVEVDYSFYLARYALIVLAESSVLAIFGDSAVEPKVPNTTLQNFVAIGQVYQPADSLNGMVPEKYGIETISVEGLQLMKGRIERLEFNLADTILDLEAQNIEISNKKGILTDEFANFSKADLGHNDIDFSIDPDRNELTLPQTFSAYQPIIDGVATTATINGQTASLTSSGTNEIVQDNHSGDESTAPFLTIGQNGFFGNMVMTVTPDRDDWVEPVTETVTRVDDLSFWVFRGRNGQFDRFTQENMEEVDGTIRVQTLTVKVEGLLPGDVEYFCKFANRDVVCTPINGTPASLGFPDGVKAKADRTAEFTFPIPAGIPEGSVPVDFFSEVLFNAALEISDPTSSVKSIRVENDNTRTSDDSIMHSARVSYVASVRRNVTRQFDRQVPPPPPPPRPPVQVRQQSFQRAVVNRTVAAPVAQAFTPSVGPRIVFSSFFTSPTGMASDAVLNRIPLPSTGISPFSSRAALARQLSRARFPGNPDPLAQTIDNLHKNTTLKSITVQFASLAPSMGVTCQIRETTNGFPNETVIAEKHLLRSQLSLDTPIEYVFDDPLFIDKDKTIAIVFKGDTEFLLNAPRFISQGNDIRLHIAKLGDKDITTNEIIGVNPFVTGVFFRSLEGLTWEADQETDLRFTAKYNTYTVDTEEVLYFNSISHTDLTHFIFNADVTTPEGTKVTWEYEVDGSGKWVIFAPYVTTNLQSTGAAVRVRARLSTTIDTVTPSVNLSGITLVGLSRKANGTYVTLNVVQTQAFTTLDVFIEFHQPPGAATHTIGFAVDTVGTAWTNFDNTAGNPQDQPPVAPTGALVGTPEPIDLNADSIYFRYHYRVTSLVGSPTDFRIRILGSTSLGGRVDPPRWRNLIAITS